MSALVLQRRVLDSDVQVSISDLGISTHIRQIVVRVSSAHSSDFPHVFGDEEHPQGFDYLVIGRNWNFEFLLEFQLLG